MPEHKADRHNIVLVSAEQNGMSLQDAMPEHKADHKLVLADMSVTTLGSGTPREAMKQKGFARPDSALCEGGPSFTPKQLRTPLTRGIYRREMLSRSMRVMLVEG